MAARNLSRTVVEGGRHSVSQLDRRLLRRRERRLVCDDDAALGPPLRSNRPFFFDRLSPLRRWVRSQVGRGWNNVYREFCARFDQRKVKGWHLKDHLLTEVGLGPRRFGERPFFVDARGILRVRQRSPRARRKQDYADRCRARRLAADRRVIVHAEALFWTARGVNLADQSRRFSPQGARLTDDEVAFWTALPEGVRRELTYVSARADP